MTLPLLSSYDLWCKHVKTFFVSVVVLVIKNCIHELSVDLFLAV